MQEAKVKEAFEVAFEAGRAQGEAAASKQAGGSISNIPAPSIAQPYGAASPVAASTAASGISEQVEDGEET